MILLSGNCPWECQEITLLPWLAALPWFALEASYLVKEIITHNTICNDQPKYQIPGANFKIPVNY